MTIENTATYADLGAIEKGVAEGEPAFEWCIVEIFGHRRHAGRGRQEERFGTKMLRVDVPIKGDPANGWETHFYGGSAIFSYTLTDEATVMQMNKPYEPPSRYRLSPPAQTCSNCGNDLNSAGVCPDCEDADPNNGEGS